MARPGVTRDKILGALAAGEPLSSREVILATGLSRSQVYKGLHRCWRAGLILRTERPIFRRERVFKGRGGSSAHTRPFHLYLLGSEGSDDVVVGGLRFVGYDEEHLDARGGGGMSKAGRVLGFLRENKDRAFFSRDVVDALSEHGVRSRDIMANVRRYERQGLVYVRGYKTDEVETPFRRGFLLAWMDDGLPREEAITDAVRRTDAALEGRASGSP